LIGFGVPNHILAGWFLEEDVAAPAFRYEPFLSIGAGRKLGLGTSDVTDKSTGAKLSEVGIASPEDVSAVASAAREAQKECAKVASPKASRRA
jgi:acyl-CoA reductase-like NAD-dependent aldehyde dehydrogenase